MALQGRIPVNEGTIFKESDVLSLEGWIGAIPGKEEKGWVHISGREEQVTDSGGKKPVPAESVVE